MRRFKRVFALILSLFSVATVAAAPDNETCRFLGPDWEWDRVEVVIQHGSPLFGLREVYLNGDGSIFVLEVRPDARSGAIEKHFEPPRSPARARQLVEALCRGDVLDERRAPASQTGHTCSGPPRLYVRNVAGEIREVPFPRDGRSPEHDAAWLDAYRLKSLFVGAAPVHEAPYVPGFVPPGFEDWATDRVPAHRPSRFVRPPSPEARQRALEDYRRAERIQERLVEAEEDR